MPRDGAIIFDGPDRQNPTCCAPAAGDGRGLIRLTKRRAWVVMSRFHADEPGAGWRQHSARHPPKLNRPDRAGLPGAKPMLAAGGGASLPSEEFPPPDDPTNGCVFGHMAKIGTRQQEESQKTLTAKDAKCRGPFPYRIPQRSDPVVVAKPGTAFVVMAVEEFRAAEKNRAASKARNLSQPGKS